LRQKKSQHSAGSLRQERSSLEPLTAGGVLVVLTIAEIAVIAAIASDRKKTPLPLRGNRLLILNNLVSS
jgi:hypothetical protein